MAKKLHRYYSAAYLHFITTSCYRRGAVLDTPRLKVVTTQVSVQRTDANLDHQPA